MSPDEAIMLALATGAAARMDPNVFEAEQPEVIAYQELLALLSREYGGVEARMMEISPGSQERQELLADQIRESGAAEDAAVLRQSREVLREVLGRSPSAVTAVFADLSAISEALDEIEENL